jgi:hypothetical protein
VAREPAVVVTGPVSAGNCAAASVPVTPVARGSPVPFAKPIEAGVPVAFVRMRDDGVSRAGVVRLGELARTTAPLPVVVAAIIAVPLPANTGAVTVVLNVIAGVVVAVATVPARPLAETTETLVTVPDPPLPLYAAVMIPSAATVIFAFVYEPAVTPLAGSEISTIPVPPGGETVIVPPVLVIWDTVPAPPLPPRDFNIAYIPPLPPGCIDICGIGPERCSCVTAAPFGAAKFFACEGLAKAFTPLPV